MSLTKTHIDDLLALCKKNNSLAQLEVYKRYQKAMYNTAVQIVKDSAIAEDVMQESFITAFDKLESFKGTATFGAWLKRIVINNSITQYKKNKRYVALDEMQLEDTEDEHPVEESSFSHIKGQQLIKAMDFLKESYRQVLVLHYVEGYDYEEMTEILNISYGSCRTLLSRAKQSLRNKLNTL